jgi:pectate lyase
VRPTAFAAGAQAWFGLMARVVDSSNYYYVTVRNNNTISLRRLTNGVIQVLDTAPLNVAAGTAYTLRLEAIGTSLRAYVNGRLLVEATDATIDAGRYGLVTYRTAAEFDDFLVTQP